MRITGDRFPAAMHQTDPSRRSIPTDSLSAIWIGMAVVGAVLSPLVHEPLGVAACAGAVAIGAFQTGRRVLRDDPRVAALTAQLERARRDRDAMLEYLAAHGRDAQVPAAGDGGGGQPPAPPAARPSAQVRGGGRPGAVAAPAPLRPLDAPLDADDGAATDEATR